MSRYLNALRAELGDYAVGKSDEQLLSELAEATGRSPGQVAAEYGYDAGRGSRAGERFSASIDNYQGSLYGVAEAGSRALGLRGVADWAARQRGSNEFQADVARERAAELGAISSYRDVNSLGDFGNYLSGLAIDSAPYLAEAAAGGVVTRAALAPVRAGMSARAVRGASMAGGAAATYPSAVGDILSAQREESGEMDLGSAALGGVPYAALNVLGLEGAAARGGLFRNAAGRLDEAGGVRGGLVRAGATGARVGFSEGVSETGQESVNQYFGRMATNPDETMFNPEAMDRYAESFVGGALLGGSVGAAAGGWRRSEGYQPNIPSADQPGGTDLLQGDRPAFQLDYSAVPVGPDMPLPPGAGPVNAADPRQVAMFDERGMPTYNADPSFGFGLEAAETANPTRDPTFAPTGGELSQPGFQMEAFRPQGQGELFSYDQLPPGGPEALPAEPPAPPISDTRSGDMFDSRPTATVQTDFSTPALLRELRVAHENKTDGWLTKFANGLSKVITDPAKAAEFLENAQEDNINSRASQATTARRDKVLAAARQIAQRFQSRMLDAQAQEGVARARPGVRVGQQPTSTATAEAMRASNERAAFDEQLADTDARVAASRRQGVLDSVLNDPNTRNPLGRFTAQLKKIGLPAVPTAEEQARIRRYLDARAGLTGQGQGELRLDGEQLGGRTLPVAEPNPAPVEKAGRRQPKTQLGLDFDGKQQVRRKQGVKNGEEMQQAPQAAQEVAPLTPEAREAKKRKYETLLQCLTG